MLYFNWLRCAFEAVAAISYGYVCFVFFECFYRLATAAFTSRPHAHPPLQIELTMRANVKTKLFEFFFRRIYHAKLYFYLEAVADFPNFHFNSAFSMYELLVFDLLVLCARKKVLLCMTMSLSNKILISINSKMSTNVNAMSLNSKVAR